jgi:hypothetical protein
MQCLDDAEVILKPRARPSRARSAPAPPRPLRVSQKDVLLHGTCGDCGPEDRPIASTSTGVRRKARRSLRA